MHISDLKYYRDIRANYYVLMRDNNLKLFIALRAL